MIFLVLVAFISAFSGAVAVDLTPANCKLNTAAVKNTPRLLQLTMKANPDNVAKTTFEILGRNLEFDLRQNLKIFIKINPTEDETACKFGGANVELTAEIKAPNDVESLAAGDTVILANGNMKIGVVHGGRNVVPISIKNLEKTNTATFELKVPRQNFLIATTNEHLFSIPKELFETGEANFKIELKVKDNTFVEVKNLNGEKAPVPTNSEVSFTCLGAKCPIDFKQLAEGVVLSAELTSGRPIEENLVANLILSPKTGEKKIPLQKNVAQVFKYAKAEIDDPLVASFETNLNNDPPKPYRLKLRNGEKIGDVLISSPKTKLETITPTNGIYKFPLPKDIQKFNLKLLNPDKGFIEFNIINNDAASPQDSKKMYRFVKKDEETTFVFFKDQLKNDRETEFTIKNQEKKRVEFLFQKDNSNIFEIKTGASQKIKPNEYAVLRKPKNIPVMTLVLQLTSQENEVDFKIGGKKVKITKREFYHYVDGNAFGERDFIECSIEGNQGEINIFKLDSKAAFPILEGEHTYHTSGPFEILNLKDGDAVTFKIKSPGTATGPVSLEVRNARVNKNIKVEVQRGTEKQVFIYPEDLNKETKVTGTLTLTGEDTVNIDYQPRIAPIEMAPGRVGVKKNTVILVSNEPKKAHILEVKLEAESKAETLKVKAGANEITLDEKRREDSLILPENFLEQKHLIEFETDPPTETSVVTLTLKAIESAKCAPACQGNTKCVQEGGKWQCVCRLGYGGPNCLKECQPACQGNRDCVEVKGKPECVCKPGFSGPDCTKVPEPKCEPVCQGNRDCVERGGKWECVCKPGFSGPNCAEDPKCQPDCQGNRDCVKVDGNWKCVCKLGFSGPDCTKVAEPKCQPVCEGNRDCVEVEGKWKCVCKPGFSGPNCAEDPKCQPVCQGNRDCVKVEGNWKCVCKLGFSGPNCAKVAEPKCEPACGGNRDCMEVEGKWKCVCKPGFSGPNCAEDPKCQAACEGNRHCVKTGEKWECVCKPGFSGPNCVQDSQCDPACEGNRKCVQDGTKWNCVCKEGYTGKDCVKEAKCTPACEGNAECVEDKGKYVCACKAGYSGPRCLKGTATGKGISILLSVVSIIISFLAF